MISPKPANRSGFRSTTTPVARAGLSSMTAAVRLNEFVASGLARIPDGMVRSLRKICVHLANRLGISRLGYPPREWQA